jgi:hypothetical protein
MTSNIGCIVNKWNFDISFQDYIILLDPPLNFCGPWIMTSSIYHFHVTITDFQYSRRKGRIEFHCNFKDTNIGLLVQEPILILFPMRWYL